MGQILFCLSGILLFLNGCSGNVAFNRQAESATFQQNTTANAKQVDILWVIDNSLSMENSQANLASNLNSFIDAFTQRGLDFQMATITTEAYLSDFSGDMTKSEFRNGNANSGPTGYKIISPSTPNFFQVFMDNTLQGTSGSGDERALQSIRTSLLNPLNLPFPRPKSFLSVIIVSDEDDFSHDEQDVINGNYTDPRLHPVSTYFDFLDQLTRINEWSRSFNVSAITVLDNACLSLLGSGKKIGRRHLELVNLTGGIKGSICDNFGPTLSNISAKILELVTRFRLGSTPRIDTISVIIDGKTVPQNLTQGWSYESKENSILFHGEYVPKEGAAVTITYVPVEAR